MTTETSDDPGLDQNLEHAVARRVRDLRSARGWSQADLAQRLARYGFDMHQTTMAKLEAAARPIRVNEVHALAQIFGMDPRDLLSPKDDERAQALNALLWATRRAKEAQQRERVAVAELDRAREESVQAARDRAAAASRFNELQIVGRAEAQPEDGEHRG